MDARRALVLSLMTAALLAYTTEGAEPKPTTKAKAKEAPELRLGRELFLRSWQTNDSRSHGGDGLGPVFNDVSCVSCHSQGEVGGGGPKDKNVVLLSALADPDLMRQAKKKADRGVTPTRRFSTVDTVHPAFKQARSVLIHLQGDQAFTKWRESLLPPEPVQRVAVDDPPASGGGGWGGGGGGNPILRRLAVKRPVQKKADESQVSNAQRISERFNQGDFNTSDGFRLVMSTRNSTALFGAGKLNRIPDDVLREVADRSLKGHPEITGRVCELADGKIGRFGWKAQIASLEDFVLTACANELGLDVPGHAQPLPPTMTNYQTPGHDMSEAECTALVKFVGDLPTPVKINGRNAETGEKLFQKVGCALCHLPKLGDVTGVYSDLLLHDMGPELSASGAYSSIVPDTTEHENLTLISAAEENDIDAFDKQDRCDDEVLVGALSSEWRTPPLWGVRDSAPYLHDGRAETIEQAILMHGGEAQKAVDKYSNLSQDKQQQLREFLLSLVAPYPGHVYTGSTRRD